MVLGHGILEWGVLFNLRQRHWVLYTFKSRDSLAFTWFLLRIDLFCYLHTLEYWKLALFFLILWLRLWMHLLIVFNMMIYPFFRCIQLLTLWIITRDWVDVHYIFLSQRFARAFTILSHCISKLNYNYRHFIKL